MTNAVAVDIGNSALKMLTPEGLQRFEYGVGWDMRLFPEQLEERLRVAYVSVNPPAESIFVARVRTTPKLDLVDMAAAFDSQKAIDFSGIKGMGMDRKSGLFGALAYSPAPFITVDCGTAITINVVDENAKCLGGAIVAGVETSLRALRDFTGQLPMVQAGPVEHSAGADTEQAMRLGAVRGSAGGIQRIVSCIQRDYFGGRELPVFISGGFAESIRAELQEWSQELRHVPNLVCEGILALLEQA